jgi:hypothetical protein
MYAFYLLFWKDISENMVYQVKITPFTCSPLLICCSAGPDVTDLIKDNCNRDFTEIYIIYMYKLFKIFIISRLNCTLIFLSTIICAYNFDTTRIHSMIKAAFLFRDYITFCCIYIFFINLYLSLMIIKYHICKSLTCLWPMPIYNR